MFYKKRKEEFIEGTNVLFNQNREINRRIEDMNDEIQILDDDIEKRLNKRKQKKESELLFDRINVELSDLRLRIASLFGEKNYSKIEDEINKFKQSKTNIVLLFLTILGILISFVATALVLNLGIIIYGILCFLIGGWCFWNICFYYFEFYNVNNGEIIPYLVEDEKSIRNTKKI